MRIRKVWIKIVFLHEVKDNLLKYLYQTVALILPSREGFGLP